MKIIEVQKNLFDLADGSHYLAHCISADYALGAGIAVEFNKRYDMRRKLRSCGPGTYPHVVQVEQVFNLVTKEKYWHKPTYESLESTLIKMKDMMVKESIEKLAMPRIGSGLDRLNWLTVKAMIERVFGDTDVEITICYI